MMGHLSPRCTSPPRAPLSPLRPLRHRATATATRGRTGLLAVRNQCPRECVRLCPRGCVLSVSCVWSHRLVGGRGVDGRAHERAMARSQHKHVVEVAEKMQMTLRRAKTMMRANAHRPVHRRRQLQSATTDHSVQHHTHRPTDHSATACYIRLYIEDNEARLVLQHTADTTAPLNLTNASLSLSFSLSLSPSPLSYRSNMCLPTPTSTAANGSAAVNALRLAPRLPSSRKTSQRCVLYSARAMLTRAFCPPLRLMPRSPMLVSDHYNQRFDLHELAPSAWGSISRSGSSAAASTAS